MPARRSVRCTIPSGCNDGAVTTGASTPAPAGARSEPTKPESTNPESTNPEPNRALQAAGLALLLGSTALPASYRLVARIRGRIYERRTLVTLSLTEPGWMMRLAGVLALHAATRTRQPLDGLGRTRAG